MVGESGGGEDGGVCGYCTMADSCLKGEGEGCQFNERRCGATRSAVGGVSRWSDVSQSMEIMVRRMDMEGEKLRTGEGVCCTRGPSELEGRISV